MIFLIISILVPLTLYFFLPLATQYYLQKPAHSKWVLLISCFFFFISWQLPSPLIDGHNTQFMTHLVGGGIFSGFVWLYLTRQLDIKMSWFLELISLYALVSSLGVANELFELLVVRTGLVRLSYMDTWWDLLANTLGAALFWLGYQVWTAMRP